MLKRIVSGAQTGADQSGLVAASLYNIPTGGWMPKGFITQDGKHPELALIYNLKEHDSPKYPPRTYLNCKESDGTIRFASNFASAGEICTLKAIQQYNKSYIDVDLNNPISPKIVAQWIQEENIEILNIAGNSNKSSPGIEKFVVDFLSQVFEELGFKKKESED